MDQVTLKNFRCFGGQQSARLAPLTLLVGENSTGKTSFMAMIRALAEVVSNQVPDFKEPPYDLGSFDEIIHRRGRRRNQPETFGAGFESTVWEEESDNGDTMSFRFNVTFGRKGTTPIPVLRRYARGTTWLEEHLLIDQQSRIVAGTYKGSWVIEVPERYARFAFQENILPPPLFLLRISMPERRRGRASDFRPLDGSGAFGTEEWELLEDLVTASYSHQQIRPFASAPVRSKPRRTYDPSRPTPDPEGDNVPMYLANLFFQNKESWQALEERLESFGKAAGLFDEISIRPLGRGSEPFQVQLRRFGTRNKGGSRNLADMGYGVSQVLPIITELLRSDASQMFLFQQPEVHLHPTAQAELGSLFCQVAAAGRQLVVETHSDHLLDRVRMGVRDGVGGLKPSDVSILFFERVDLDVRIHSLEVDEGGNIVGAPDGYRKFFMEETQRSLGL